MSSTKGWDSVFVFPLKHKKAYPCEKCFAVSHRGEQGLYRRIYYLTGLHYGFAPLSTSKIIRILKQEKPDLVNLHSVNCAMVNIYKLLDYLKAEKIPTVITNHAEFFYTGNCPHSFDCNKWMTGCGHCEMLFYATESKFLDRSAKAWKMMKKAFENFDQLCVVSVSPWVESRSLLSPILNSYPHRVIMNGVDNTVFCNQSIYMDNRSRRIILHVTANFSDEDNDRKGGSYIVALAERLIGQNVDIYVIGQNETHKKMPENLHILGQIFDQRKISEWYQKSDLCVVTSKRETFGMTVAEALCCGTPVVGFQSGGSESIAIPEYSAFTPFGDIDSLERLIMEKWLWMKNNDNNLEISDRAEQIYSGKKMASNYCNLYTEMCKYKDI